MMSSCGNGMRVAMAATRKKLHGSCISRFGAGTRLQGLLLMMDPVLDDFLCQNPGSCSSLVPIARLCRFSTIYHRRLIISPMLGC